MSKNAVVKLRILLAVRIVLWIVALAATIRWISFSVWLTNNGIYDPLEYGSRLRPVLYPCLLISIAAVALCFPLYFRGRKIKTQAKAESFRETV